QFVDFGNNYLISTVMELQPGFEFQVLFHAPSAGVDQYKRESQTAAVQQVGLNQLLPLVFLVERHLRISVSRKVHEPEIFLDLVEVDELRAAWLGAGKRKPGLADKPVQQARLTHITSTQKRNLVKVLLLSRFRRELLRFCSADHQARRKYRCLHHKRLSRDDQFLVSPNGSHSLRPTELSARPLSEPG